MTPEQVSDAAREILRGIRSYGRTSSSGASVRDLALFVRRSHASVRTYLHQLKKGRLVMSLEHPGREVRWKLTAAGEEYLAAQKEEVTP